MMKQLRNILLATLALFALTVSCVDPLEPVPGSQSSIPSDALVFSPTVLGITPATKTPGDEDFDRGENKVTRLDVFVYITTGGTSTFHKHYTIGDGSEAIDTSVDYLLESNWRLNYTLTDTYRIYAIANINANKLNDPILPDSPSETELLNLTSESDAKISGQYGYTCYDIVRLKNVEGTTPAEAGSLDHHISDKLFLMDGKIDNWQIDQTAAKQYFTKAGASATNSFDLSRAAAKFRVELDFSQSFKNRLGTEDVSTYSEVFQNSLGPDFGQGLKFVRVVDTWPLGEGETKPTPKTVDIITIGAITPDSGNKVYASGVVTGGARAKFANILKATYNIAPPAEPSATTTPTATQLSSFRDANLWDSQNFYEFSWRTPNGTYGTGENETKLYKYPYVDTTYSYAFSWEASQAAEKAPALAVSIIYTTYTQKYNADGSFNGEAESDGGVTNYYRVPLVDIFGASEDETTDPVTPARAPINSVERNYYYQVKAEINTMGTSTTDIEPNKVHLKYKIIPWPDAPDEKTEAQTTQLLYFVPEKEYRLRGDGEQFVYLQYFTPKSDPIAGSSPTYYEYTPKIKNIKVYYYNQSGAKHYLVGSESSGASASGSYIWDSDNETPILATDPAANVHIEVQANAQGGRFYILSEALENRSVKYIEFDAEVNFGAAGKVTHTIRVYHFPLDNLQSVLGAWSSRWNGNSSSTTTTEYSFNPVADGWDSWTGYVDDIECTFEEYNSAEPEHRSTTTITGTRTATREEFLNNVTTNTDRAAANSEANAVHEYWGTNPSDVRYQNTDPGTATINDNWDYWDRYWNGYGPYNDYNMHKYAYYYTKAEMTVYKARRYYRTITVNVPSTGNWVDWDRDEGQTYNNASNAKYTYDGSNFEAKVYNNGLVYGINVSSNYTYSVATTQESVQAGMGGSYYYTTGAWYRFFTNGTRDRVASNMTGLNNNHMYVIQISKAGKDKYGNDVIIGRPVLDGAYQSDDNTVSPAFMIASQLGAVSTFGTGENAASNAASHCHTYMEVAQNGRRFTGWRLPTQAEVAYIIQYQTDLSGSDVFDDVLTGHYYYTLNKGADGNRWADTGKNDDNHAVRCIRDLTPEEVKELNDTGTITSNTY